MHAIFHISEVVDDAGVAMYTAMLPSDLDAEGIPDPSAPRGHGETVWQAVASLCEQLDGVDADMVLFMGEEGL